MKLLLISLFLLNLLPERQAYGSDVYNLDSLRILLEKKSKKEIPGLKEKVDYSVSGLGIKDFLRALAESSNLNMHIDERIQGKVSNNFQDEKTFNVLLFICEAYNLSLSFHGTIISVNPIETERKVSIYKSTIVVNYSSFDNQISVEALADTLNLVIQEIVKKSGFNIIPEPGIKHMLVDCHISNLDFNEAINALAFANGLKARKNREGTFFLESAIIKGQEPNSSGRKISNGRGTNFSNRRYEENELFLESKISDDNIIINANIENIPLDQVLEQLSEETGLNYIFFDLPQNSLSLQVSGITHDEFLDFTLKGTAYTYAYKDNVYCIGKRNQEGLRSSELVQFKYRSVSELAEMIPSDLSQNVEIKPFEELNGILISGSLPQINEIRKYLKPLDRLVPLILIEVMAIDIKRGRDINTGIKVGTSDSIKTGGSLLPGLNFTLSSNSINALTDIINTKGIINLGKVNPNFYASLQAMELNNNIKIRSTPKLATLNGHEASLTIGQTEYYLEQTQNIQGGNNVVTTITPQYREIQADLSISIDPLVSADDQVTLEILAEFAAFTDPFTINGPPGKSTRRFESIVRMRNEEMIVLGGLEEQRRTKQTEGVPLLSRVPVLKWLFSSVSTAKNETKLLVFIKPTIVY